MISIYINLLVSINTSLAFSYIFTISQIQAMAKYNIVFLFFVFFVWTSIILLVCDAIANSEESGKLHIVYMGSLPKAMFGLMECDGMEWNGVVTY